jgi:predicted AAA+ superfamily ATPase
MKQSVVEDVAASQKKLLLTSDSGLKREALDSLPNVKSHALIISGIRRCGKSTLLHQYLQQKNENFFYLHFEDIRLYDFQMKDFVLLDKIIERSKQKLLFFDEIQSVKGWELYIRQKLDQRFRVVITGSNASLLSRELGTKLTGRHITKTLFPFSFNEFAAFKKLKPSLKSLEQYMRTGGFPEFAKDENLETLKALVDDILYRDIAVRHGVKDAASIKRLLSYLFFNAARLASPSKLTDVAKVKSPTTVLEYFSHFEDSYLTFLLPKFSYSAKSQMLSPKKVYVVDTGLIRAGAILLTENYGYLLENVVFTHLRRQMKELFYFNENSRECDFVQLENGKAKNLLQVCWELNTDNEEREVKGLLGAMDYFKLTKGTIVTANQQDTIYHGNLEIEVVPAWKFLSA